LAKVSDFNNIRFQPSGRLLRELSADRLNTILQEIKRNKPKGERGITVRQDGTGTYIGLAAALPRAGGAALTRQPWDLIARVDPDADPEEESPSYIVRVHPGLVSGFLPTNWDEEFICEPEGLFYAKAAVSSDGQAITGLSISIDTQPPLAQEPQEFGIAAEVEILFGLFLERQVYRTVGPGNINATPTLWLTTEKQTAPRPGEIPYIQFFVLQ